MPINQTEREQLRQANDRTPPGFRRTSIVSGGQWHPTVEQIPTTQNKLPAGMYYDAAGYPQMGTNPGKQPSNQQRQLLSDLTTRQGGGAVTPPPLPGREPLPAREAAPSLKGLMEAGGAAILARAKENQGNIARSAVGGLRAALGERGVLGSGIEANATGDIASRAMQGITDVNREQLIQQDEIARRFAELGYTGGISQRGQDIGQGVQQRGQDITGRGQDIQALLGNQSSQNSQLQMILDALRGMAY